MGVLTFSLIAPVLPDLADDLEVPRSSIGLIQGAVAIPGIFLAMTIGYLADKRGRRFIGSSAAVSPGPRPSYAAAAVFTVVSGRSMGTAAQWRPADRYRLFWTPLRSQPQSETINS